jgi:hypothetical protein
MNTFVLLYNGGKAPSSPEEGAKVMKVWQAWFDKLGKTVVDMGKPFGQGKTVTSSGIKDGAHASNGYTIVQAESLAAAATIAKGCPIISDGGEVQVFETMAM